MPNEHTPIEEPVGPVVADIGETSTLFSVADAAKQHYIQQPTHLAGPDMENPKAQASHPIHVGGFALEPETLISESKSTETPLKYPRISRQVPMMRSEYDVVVVGSGYGGAVAASRMARAGKSVCLLELGKERWPGEFPADSIDCAKEFHVSGKVEEGSILAELDTGNRQGLYHFIVGEGQDAFVANGLGGTSLLNANVFLKADHRTLSQDIFPPEIRKHPEDLDKYYERAASVLQPTEYPEDFPTLPKLKVLEEQAKLLGDDFKERFYRVPQTTTFKDRLNSTGVYQKKSTLSGQDATGINDWSKNTTLMNYLPDAWNHGAEIFCDCEVRYIKPCKKGDNKWTVFFAWHADKREKFEDALYTELMWVQAREFVFLGAGTFGTTEILLRSCAHGLKLSRSLGMNLSGNGDILAFGHNTNRIVNAIGKEDLEYLAEHPVGPCICGVIDMRDEIVAPNVLDGYVIEEGVAPAAFAPFLETMFNLIPDKIEPHDQSLLQKVRQHASEADTALHGPYTYGGSLNRTMIYLMMSHDDNQGTLTLEDNKPVLRFVGVSRSAHHEFLTRILANATNRMGGTYAENPFMSSWLGNSEITVHPIGGASMSSDGTGARGVTNHLGQVFKGKGSDVYDGLVVVDGAVIPAALGVNPFATITALAERSVEGVAKEKGITIDYESKNGVIDWTTPKVSWPLTDEMKQAQMEISNSPKVGGARFTEIMEGYLYVGDDIEDYEMAVEAAKGCSSTARFYLSVDAWDIDTLKHRDNHAAMLTGTFSCGALSCDPFLVLRGDFQLFSIDSRTPDTRNLVYDFDMISTSGEIVHFHGYKLVDPSITCSMKNTWKATTTLYVTLAHPDKSIIGRGILTISATNFAKELMTFDGIGESTWTKVASASGFLSYFTDRLSESVFSPLNALQYPHATATGFYEKQAPTKNIVVTASDGVKSTLHKWVPERLKGHGTPILLVPGASVDYQIFALPSIPFNLVDYLLEHGYTVYSIDHRVGKVPSARDNWTTYDSRLDIAAAVDYIRETECLEKIYAIVHCAGAEAMAAGLLDGTIHGIGGLTASQVFMNPLFAEVNMIKAKTTPVILPIYEKTLGGWYDVIPHRRDCMVEKLINEALRAYPVQKSQEICHSVVCHKSELAFGRLWTHANLNEATHENLDRFVGGVSIRNLKQLVYMATNGFVVNNDLQSLVTVQNIERLRDIQILFIHGGQNAVYSPESTMRSYDSLRDQLDSSHYERWVFEERGHLDCWMGKSSYMDVYPVVEQHARKTIALQGMSK